MEEPETAILTSTFETGMIVIGEINSGLPAILTSTFETVPVTGDVKESVSTAILTSTFETVYNFMKDRYYPIRLPY